MSWRVLVGLLLFSLPGYAECPDPSWIWRKMDLWSSGTCLRGANIWQKTIEPEFDGDTFGNGAVGPPYTLENLKRLAGLGANYVNISVPGVFPVNPPYTLDARLVDNLDNLIHTAEQADLFVVLSLRTGPGRNEAGFDDTEKERAIHRVWEDTAAQAAWVEMWKYLAGRYRSSKAMVGYDLLVEPNANWVFFRISDPVEFFWRYKNTTYDWNPMAERIISAIREKDRETPILMSGMNYSEIAWLSVSPPISDKKIIYTVHQYTPYKYTHGKRPGPTYPGIFDGDEDGKVEMVDRAWLAKMLAPLKSFKKTREVPVAVNEFGVTRWQRGADKFMEDSISIFEDECGANHATWLWETDLNIGYDAFNFRFGPNPKNHTDVAQSALLDALKRAWSKNRVRPSQLNF